jgi:hypothetical protein
MKAKLIKTGSDYLLRDMGGNVLAITNGTTEGRKLSKQNCDEIFGVVDVEKLAIEYDLYEKINFVGQTRAYKAGFQKAMELNKDKLFTLEDMINCWNKALKFQVLRQTFGEYIQSIQQPTEIEVEIEMICPHPMDTYRCGLQYGCDGDGCNHPNQIPYLDSEGCLILKKI